MAINSNDKILVTGADGFIGSHLSEELVRRGYQVRALVWYNAFGHRGWLDRVNPELQDKMEIMAGDVRDPHAMLELVDGTMTIIHLASLIGIPYSYHSPDSYIQTNVTGTLNLLQAARRSGVKRFVQTSTSEVYGSAQRIPMDESHPLSAQSPYAASKIASDQLAGSFYCSFDLSVVTIRPFNTFGPRQSTRAVIPTIISQLMTDREQIYLGQTDSRRDFTFVGDIVNGFIAAVETERDKIAGETINLGSGTEIAIGELAERIASLMGKQVKIVADDKRIRPEASEVDRLLCDNKKARRLLGWEPTIDFDDALKQTIDWFGCEENIMFARSADRYGI